MVMIAAVTAVNRMDAPCHRIDLSPLFPECLYNAAEALASPLHAGQLRIFPQCCPCPTMTFAD
jgi:hypothetical protein